MWRSLPEVLIEFKIAKDTHDIEGIRQELKKLMSEVHPDKTNGNYANSEQEQRYLRLNEALEYVDQLGTSTAVIVPTEQIAAITTGVTKALLQQDVENKRRDNKRQIRSEYRSEVWRIYRTPIITSATAFCITAAVFGFSENLKEQPFYDAVREWDAQSAFASVTASTKSDVAHATKIFNDINTLLGSANISTMGDRFTAQANEAKEKITEVGEFLKALNDVSQVEEHIFDDPQYYEQRIQGIDSTLTVQINNNLGFMFSSDPSKATLIGNVTDGQRQAALGLFLELEERRGRFQLVLREHLAQRFSKAKERALQIADWRIAFLMAGLLLLLGGVLGYCLLREHAQERTIEWFLSDEGLNEAVRKVYTQGLHGSHSNKFTARHFKNLLGEKSNLSPSLLQQVTNTMLRELIARRAITKLELADVDNWYEISPTVINRFRCG